jgi:TolB-like protein
MREKITPQKAVRKWEQNKKSYKMKQINRISEDQRIYWIISGSIRYTTNVVNITCQRLPASHCQTGYY